MLQGHAENAEYPARQLVASYSIVGLGCMTQHVMCSHQVLCSRCRDMLRGLSTQLDNFQHFTRLSDVAVATRQRLRNTALQHELCAPPVCEHATSMSNVAYVPVAPLQPTHMCEAEMHEERSDSDCACATPNSDETASLEEGSGHGARADSQQGPAGQLSDCGLPLVCPTSSFPTMTGPWVFIVQTLCY